MADNPEAYGRSPALDALDALRKWNALTPAERATAATEYMEQVIAQMHAESTSFRNSMR